MVELVTPSSRICRVRLPATDKPYFIMEDGDYPDGWNGYVLGRVAGSIDSDGVDVRYGKPLSENTARNLYFDIYNILSWGEAPYAHPVQGVIRHNTYADWHIDELYQDSLRAGYWTQEYWATGTRLALGAQTIERRIREGSAAIRWMREHGVLPVLSPDASLDHRERSKRAAIASLESLVPISMRAETPKYKKKLKPGEFEPYSIVFLDSLLKAIEEEAVRLAANMMITHGFRLKETEENLLLPGVLYQRPRRYAEFSDSTFPLTPYRLKFSGQKDLMTGVIPPFDLAFQEDDAARAACRYYILGKGPKIRLVTLMPYMARTLWRFKEGGRAKILEDAGIPEHLHPAELLIDERGAPLTSDQIYRGIVRASDKLGLNPRATPHVLRHTFACLFLETSIVGLAQEDGVDQDNISLDQIEKYGSRAITALKKILGHSLLKTTMIYLEKLTSGVLQMRLIKYFEDVSKGLSANGA